MKPYKKALLKPWWDKYPDYLPLGAKFRGKWQKGTVARIIKEIDKRTKDILIAEKIFGAKVEIIEMTHYEEYGGQTDYPELGYVEMRQEPYISGETSECYFVDIGLPNYSSDLKDTWLLVKHLQKQGYEVSCTESNHCRIPLSLCKIRTHHINYVLGTGNNISEAVCEAALKLVENDSK